MAAAAKAARRSTFMHLPNDPFQDPRIGRRTGVPLNIRARKDSHGFENIDDYFPDSDPEEENIIPNTQDTDQDPVGRRTGVRLNIKAKKDSHGFENVTDYFPDSDPEEGNVVPDTQDTDKEPDGRGTGDVSQEEESHELENVDDECPDSGVTKSKELSPDEDESADTPAAGNDESPNDTGTAIKNPASREPTPQLKGQIKKRLSFTNGRSPNESEDNEIQFRLLPREKIPEPISEETVDSDIEIDVVDVTNVSEENRHHSPSPVKNKETAKKQHRTKGRENQNHIKEDDEVIDVEEIEEQETFLTIGNNTMRTAKNNTVVDKSPLSSQPESFIMSESFVLEGTRHKTMSPEYGSGSDSHTEPDPRLKKSRIPVPQKGLPNSKRVTRGRKSKTKVAVEESQRVEIEEVEAEENEVDNEEKDLPTTQQMKSTRGRRRKADKVKPVEEVEEAKNKGVEGKEKRKAKSVSGKQQRKSTSRGEGKESKSRAVESDDEEVNDNDDEIVEVEEIEQSNDDGENEKPSGRRARAKKGVEVSKKAEQIEVVVESSEQPDEGEPTKLSGRKTRAQRKREKDARQEKDEKQSNVDEDKKEKETSSDLESGEVESENSESVETEKEIEESVENERVTRAQRKKNAKKDVEVNDELGNEVELAEIKSKRRGRKSQPVPSEKTVEEGEEKDVSEMTENEGKAKEGKRGRGRKSQAKEGRKQDAEQEENRNDLDAIKELTDEENETLKVASSNELANTTRRGRGRGRKSQAKERSKQDAEQEENSNDFDIPKELTNEGNETVKEASSNEHENTTRRGRGRKSQAKEKTIQDAEQEEKRHDPDIPKELTNEESETAKESFSNEHENTTNVVSVNSISVASSVVSSGSDSTTKAGNGAGRKRRKRSRILPPYATKRRGSKVNSSKNSSTGSSHESVSESGSKRRRLQEEGNETNVAEKSLKKGASMNPRKSGRAKRTGRASEGALRKSASPNNEAEAESVVEDVGANDLMQEPTGVGDSSFEEAPHVTDSVAPAQPVTALKSILKSGGSVGRASTVSRKRVISNKSHSGGSDADDESILPAKQPNRKRLSTVSFASTPFVQDSPSSVPSRRRASGVGLSFVSRGSSFRSTDDTFTPGSSLSVRSSLGSAGSSSTGESVIDPEEEITVAVTNDDKQGEDTSDELNTRRSKRTIIPPLQYWKNERIDYERRKSGGWSIIGVLKNPTPKPKLRRKPKKPKKPVAKKDIDKNDEESSEEELDNAELEGFQEITNPLGTVLNPESNELVEMDIFHTTGMLNFTNPSGKPAQEDDPLVVHKFISQPLFGGGQVVLRPGAEKGRQFVRNDTMVFYVIKGRVLVTVHQCSAVLDTGSSFFIPQGNSYNIKNLKKTKEAKMMFVQIKG